MSLGKFYLEKYQFSRGNYARILIFGLDLADFWLHFSYWPTYTGLDLVVWPPTSGYWPTSHLGWRHPSPGAFGIAMPSPTLCGLPISIYHISVLRFFK